MFAEIIAKLKAAAALTEGPTVYRCLADGIDALDMGNRDDAREAYVELRDRSKEFFID